MSNTALEGDLRHGIPTSADAPYVVSPVTDDEVAAAIRIDQSATIVRMIPLMMISNLVVPLTIIVTTMHVLDTWFIASWLGAMTVTVVPPLLSWLRLRNAPRPKSVSRRRIRAIAGWSTVMGLAMAVGMFYIFPRAGATSQIMTEICVLGLWAGAMVATWKVAYAIVGYVAPMAIAMLAAIFLNFENTVAGVEVAGTIVIFLGLVAWALSIHQSFYVETTRMQLEHVSQSGEISRRRKAEAELKASLNDLREMQDKLILQEKMASLGAMSAGIAHEIKNPLNFIVNFSRLSEGLVDDVRTGLKGAVPNQESDDIDADLTTLSENLEKISKHGRRADGIVKTMLMHSRNDPGTRAPTRLNPLIQEGVDLAHHGARAQDPSFNVDISVDLDEEVPTIHGSASQFMRVILNLVRNALQSARERAIIEGPDFAPEVTVRSFVEGDRIIIAIRDNGVGIAPEIRERLFQPFFTTKSAGEGTGLGLSISYEIVTQHGGEIAVDSVPFAYAEFRIVLPKDVNALISDLGVSSDKDGI